MSDLKNTILENQTLVSGTFSAVGMFITGFLSYLVAKGKNKKEKAVTDRQQLSQDEQKFRDDLYERMKTLEDQVDKYRKEVDRYHYKSISLEEEILQWKNKYVELDKEWRFRYTELEIENKHLQNKVTVLETRMKEKQGKDEENDSNTQ